MRLTIHRGTHEIGGSCVELAAGDDRLVLDLGLPLMNRDGTSFAFDRVGKTVQNLLAEGVLPPIPQLYSSGHAGTTSLVVSHAHQDHYGLAGYVHPSVPVYATDGTRALMDVSRIFLPDPVEIASLRDLPKGVPIKIGPFTVTASVVDHSAPDAVMLLVEAGGKRILYSGDLRAHGRKAALFERMVQRAPTDIDCLLLEGTMISRGRQEYPDERAVEEAIVDILRRKTNLGIVICSSQNLDRLVSIYRAVKRTGGLLVIDLYTAFLLRALRCISERIPQSDWPQVRVKYWKRHADLLAAAGHLEFLYQAKKSKIEVDEISGRSREVLLLAKANSLLPIIPRHLPCTEGVEVIWSMWDGYLTGNDPASRFCAQHGIQPRVIHTSGHATVADLQRLAGAISPKRLIPIHTFAPERFTELFDNTVMLADEETVGV